MFGGTRTGARFQLLNLQPKGDCLKKWGQINGQYIKERRFLICNLSFSLGADARDRTADLLITNQLLYRLSYIGFASCDDSVILRRSLSIVRNIPCQVFHAVADYASRFQYLQSIIGIDACRPETRIFISGFSAGSEMIAARQFGFGKIHGSEVDHFLVAFCQKRLSQFRDMYPVYYDGNNLPYESKKFDVLVSGHIVEHTRNPELL